jgi:hypothetical protein
VENTELQGAVDRDAGVEVWILFEGVEEGGTIEEEGSTCSNVRLGIWL